MNAHPDVLAHRRLPASLYIFSRQIAEFRHRRKLVAFLFLLPIIMMLLLGFALGERRVPVLSDPSVLEPVAELKHDQNLVAVLQIVARVTGDNPEPLKVLVASVRFMDNAPDAYLYVVPNSQNTSLILIDTQRSSYYQVIVNNNGSSIGATEGPKALPTRFQAMPQVDLQSLFSNDSAMHLAKASLSVFRLALALVLSPDRRLLDVLFPEMVALEIGWVGVLGSAVTAVEDRVSGARRRILMSPVSRSSFILGSAIASFAVIGLQLIVLFATAIFVFKVSIAGSLFDLVPIISAASFSVIGMGLIISHFSKTPDEAFYLSTLANLPMAFLASQYIPLANTAASLVVQSLLPMTYANKAFAAIMVHGASIITLLPQLLGLTIFAVTLYSAGTLMVMRER